MLRSKSLAAALALVAASSAFALEPSMSVTTDKSPRPIVFGSTNLPNGTQLTVSLVKQHGGYAGESKVTVVGGHFATEQFTDNDQPLPPGEYFADVQMVLPGLQSDEVQAVVGKLGQNMSGPLVVNVLSDKTVSYRANIQLGSAGSTAAPGSPTQGKKDQALPIESASHGPSYEFVSVRNFALDGPTLAAKNAPVTLTGAFILVGNVATLYPDTQAVIMADAVTQPSVPLLTDSASRNLRETLLDCQTNYGTAQVGCQITIRGRATMCSLNNVFGASRNAPCVNVEHGGRWKPPAPTLLEQGTRASTVEQPRPVPPPVADDDTAPVKAINPDAAEKIQSYCSKVAMGGGPNHNATLKSCEQQEVDAWDRVVLHREFPEHDFALDSKCSEPPFPADSFVAYEACLKYELNNR